MTRGFFTIITMPYDGTIIEEHNAKKDALQRYSEEVKKVILDKDGKVIDDSELLGVALVHMDIEKQKGNWQ